MFFLSFRSLIVVPPLQLWGSTTLTRSLRGWWLWVVLSSLMSLCHSWKDKKKNRLDGKRKLLNRGRATLELLKQDGYSDALVMMTLVIWANRFKWKMIRSVYVSKYTPKKRTTSRNETKCSVSCNSVSFTNKQREMQLQKKTIRNPIHETIHFHFSIRCFSPFFPDNAVLLFLAPQLFVIVILKRVYLVIFIVINHSMGKQQHCFSAKIWLLCLYKAELHNKLNIKT